MTVWSRKRSEQLLVRIEILERRQDAWDEWEAREAWMRVHWQRDHIREVAYATKNDPQHRDVEAWAERDEITRGAKWIGSYFTADDWEQAAYEQELLIEKRERATTVDADPRPYAPQEFSVVHVPERKYGV